LRNILDKLLYIDLYETIDGSLSDCNVGSRKRRNIRDNLFVVNAILNEGTVWAGLMCTTTMDKLGKEVYADPGLV
jgi:hypothetical protein